MHRRRFIRTVGTTGTAASLGGCLGDGPGWEGDPVDGQQRQGTGDRSLSSTGTAVSADATVGTERRLRVVFGYEIGLQQALQGQTAFDMGEQARGNREFGEARDSYLVAIGFLAGAEDAFEATLDVVEEFEFYAGEGVLDDGREFARNLRAGARGWEEGLQLLLDGDRDAAEDRVMEAADDAGRAQQYPLRPAGTLRERLGLPTGT